MPVGTLAASAGVNATCALTSTDVITMTAMATPEQTQTQVCYRHPRAETAVSCSNCGRPICTDCMVFSAVGIKCPECAGTPTGTKKAATRVRSAAGEGRDFLVTKALILLTVLV